MNAFMATYSKPRVRRILRAVLGSISRDGKVVTFVPNQIMACPPSPRCVSTLKERPRLRASSRSSAMKRSRLSMPGMNPRIFLSESQGVFHDAPPPCPRYAAVESVVRVLAAEDAAGGGESVALHPPAG